MHQLESVSQLMYRKKDYKYTKKSLLTLTKFSWP
ncbi:hypothetical protein T06_7084 [Trichinella sp. T6]|nr:hypothetical protein T06_7084 [Trichinella sp. T6]